MWTRSFDNKLTSGPQQPRPHLVLEQQQHPLEENRSPIQYQSHLPYASPRQRVGFSGLHSTSDVTAGLQLHEPLPIVDASLERQLNNKRGISGSEAFMPSSSIRKKNRTAETDHVQNQQKPLKKPKLISFKRKKGSSRYKGVLYVKSQSKWRAQICLGGKKKYIGSYDTEIEAALARDSKVLELFGFSKEMLNFPERPVLSPTFSVKQLRQGNYVNGQCQWGTMMYSPKHAFFTEPVTHPQAQSQGVFLPVNFAAEEYQQGQVQDAAFLDSINHCFFEGESLVLSPNASQRRQQQRRGFFRDF